MLDDADIQKCLERIKTSKSEHRNVPREVNSNSSITPADVTIHPTCDIRGIERMQFGNGVVIQKD
ncbi:MAG: hypothetical protein ACYC5X_17585, partial [Syntrophales bacterium]